MIVLAVSQTSQLRFRLFGRPGAGGFFLAVLKRLCQFYFRELRQLPHPGFQDCLVLTAWCDPFAAAMRRSVRGLPDQKRRIRLTAVDEFDQRPPESLNFLWRRARVRKWSRGARCDPVLGMTGAASRLFENLVKPGPKWPLLCAGG